MWIQNHLILVVIQYGICYEFYEEIYYEYDTDPDPNEEGQFAVGGHEGSLYRIPNFTSPSLDLTANFGDTVRLPCIVDHLQGFVLVWKKGERIISLGNTVLDQGYLLEQEENGNSLVIQRIVAGDEGEYLCQISAYKPTVLKHRVYIRRQPVIRTIPEYSLVVQKGEEMMLVCEVLSGSPYPNVTWRKTSNNRPIPTQGFGEVLISSASKSDSGDYVCEADNGVREPPVSHIVHVEVLYAPEIEISEINVSTEEMEGVVLACTVDANPPATVQWLYNTGSQYSARVQTVKQEHTLDNERYSMFIDPSLEGNYTCVANNSIGSTLRQISFHGVEEDVTEEIEIPVTASERGIRQSRKIVAEAQVPGLSTSGGQLVTCPLFLLLISIAVLLF